MKTKKRYKLYVSKDCGYCPPIKKLLKGMKDVQIISTDNNKGLKELLKWKKNCVPCLMDSKTKKEISDIRKWYKRMKASAEKKKPR